MQGNKVSQTGCSFIPRRSEIYSFDRRIKRASANLCPLGFVFVSWSSFINFFIANYRVPPVIWWVLLNGNERHAGLFTVRLRASLGLLELGSSPSMLHRLVFFRSSPPAHNTRPPPLCLMSSLIIINFKTVASPEPSDCSHELLCLACSQLLTQTWWRFCKERGRFYDGIYQW